MFEISGQKPKQLRLVTYLALQSVSNRLKMMRSSLLSRCLCQVTTSTFKSFHTTPCIKNWSVLRDIHNKTNFSLPEVEALFGLFQRKVGGSTKLSKEEFTQYLKQLGVPVTPELV